MKILLFDSQGKLVIQKIISPGEAFQFLNIIEPSKFPSLEEFKKKWIIESDPIQ